MDVKLSNITYDRENKQTLVTVGASQYTIPDYMMISDIEYYINDKLTKLLQDSLNMVVAQNDYEVAKNNDPLEKAKAHYKELGWDF